MIYSKTLVSSLSIYYFFWTWKNLNETLDTNVVVHNLLFVQPPYALQRNLYIIFACYLSAVCLKIK